jgi:hypothetical protein
MEEKEYVTTCFSYTDEYGGSYRIKEIVSYRGKRR